MKWGNASDIYRLQETLLWSQEEGTVIKFSVSLVSVDRVSLTKKKFV
jgi:hypothetical protein